MSERDFRKAADRALRAIDALQAIDEARWRVRVAANVLRGRPVAYRLCVKGGLDPVSSGTMVVECGFTSPDAVSGAAITIRASDA